MTDARPICRLPNSRGPSGGPHGRVRELAVNGGGHLSSGRVSAEGNIGGSMQIEQPLATKADKVCQAVKPFSRSQRNDGFSADSGPS
jgi:hypothetical protein